MPITRNPGGAEAVEIEEGSGNVFAELELENADELQMRAGLVRYLHFAIKDEGWNVSQAARELGTERP